MRIHRIVGGSGKGRRRGLGEVNNAVLLHLAAEFQGYCRDLHTLACAEYVRLACSNSNAVAQAVLNDALVVGRQLDSANAQPSSMGSDFGRLGISIWDLVKVAPRASRCRDVLVAVNTARNGIAHAEPSVVTEALNGLRAANLRTSRPGSPRRAARARRRKAAAGTISRSTFPPE